MRDGDWHTFNGDLAATKFSRAASIRPDNVARLERAWEFHSGDVSDGGGSTPKTVWSATPLYANDTLYLGTPFYRILALEPDTGALRWAYDSHARLEALTQPSLKNRGVAYWASSVARPAGISARRVYIGTMDAKLHAVDADTGAPCADFGERGVLDVNRWNDAPDAWPLSPLQPPTVYRDTLYLGWAGKDWNAASEPSGSVFAIDAVTGALRWTFEAIPAGRRASTGTANVWASMSVDVERGLLYVPVSSPSPNFYGGARTEALPLTTSITALDADTGDVVWSRQLVHHDVWDYDTNAPPTLVYPPTSGGMQWGGGALDPDTGRWYVNHSSLVQIYELLPRAEYDREATGSGDEQGYYPQTGSPYGMRLTNFLNWLGMPCWKPPYGEMSAYDLTTGKRLWRRPFGRVRKWGVDMPRAWGSPTIGGPVLTAGGVLFIGASIDRRARALDPVTGDELWSVRLEAPIVATPATYVHAGRQYAVFVAGGNPIVDPKVGDQVVAFALPEGAE